MKKENFDCPHCGQDLRLDANAPDQLRLADELAEAIRNQKGEGPLISMQTRMALKSYEQSRGKK